MRDVGVAQKPGNTRQRLEMIGTGTFRREQQEYQVDGLAIDSEGRVYDCSRLGIQVMSPDGKSLGLIPMPRGATTLAFAGPDKKTLYIIGRGHDGPGGDGALARSMYKVPMLAQGFKGRAK